MYKIEDFQITNNFKLSEFVCKDGKNHVIINMMLLEELQRLRDFIKKPVVIISGYRSRDYNSLIGGAENSYHIKGMAVDIKVDGMSVEEVYYLSKYFNFNGVGLYDGWIHLDVRGEKSFWDNRSNKRRLF